MRTHIFSMSHDSDPHSPYHYTGDAVDPKDYSWLNHDIPLLMQCHSIACV